MGGQSVKAYFLHSLAPSSLLVSSCSGPSRQVEPAPTARQIPCPGIGNGLPLPGRVVFPRALRFPPEKRCRQRHITTKRNFPQWFSSGHSGFHISDEKISKRDHYNLLNNLFSFFRIFCLP